MTRTKFMTVGLALLLPAAIAWAEDPPNPPAAQPQYAAPVDNDDQPAEPMRTVAYLGIHAQMVSPTLRAQLDLPDGVGLAISFVEPGSPAALAGLKQHDILQKLGDQLLVSPYQLKVLLRMHQPGEAIDFTVVRRGRAQTLTAALGSHEIPESAASLTMQAGGQTLPSGPLNAQGLRALQTAIEQPGQAITISNRQMSFSDGEHRLVIREDQRGRHLRATNLQGDVLYEGYLNTIDQRAEVPAPVQQKMNRLNDIQRRQQLAEPDASAAQAAQQAEHD